MDSRIFPTPSPSSEPSEPIQAGEQSNVTVLENTYVFPRQRMKEFMSDPEKDPLVLVAFGQAKKKQSNRH